jgi:hypothetical protein
MSYTLFHDKIQNDPRAMLKDLLILYGLYYGQSSIAKAAVDLRADLRNLVELSKKGSLLYGQQD